MPTKLARLAGMDHREVWWRTRAAGRIAVDRTAATMRPPRWKRADLARLLDRRPDLAEAARALGSGDWLGAHRALAAFIRDTRAPFPITADLKATAAARIRAALPRAGEDAAALADPILGGRYDLLGYRALAFGDPIDWHLDPVNGRRPPRLFWSRVPFLDPACGDHKIIWELNRHQHWLLLGRAYWLTGNAAYREAVVRESREWLAANPPLVGVNWASMLELAFRSLSWLWALNFFTDAADTDDSPWIVDLLLALDRQLLQIERHYSRYFSPNTHLIGEALALYVGGLAAPMFARSARRAALGRRILLEEIRRQIHADGGHCERSTHYHRYTLDFYLLALVVARAAGDPAAARFEAAVGSLAAAARALADDSGVLPHIGDDDGGAAFRIAGRPLDDIADSLEMAAALTGAPGLAVGAATEEAMWLLARPDLAAALETLRHAPAAASPHSRALPETGYYVSRSSAGDHLVMDAGPHGYLNGGHAHADALSLTLSVEGVPLLIDPGTHCYTTDAESRDRMRSTALHNTVVVNGRPAAEADGAFHWRRIADSRVHRWRANRGFDFLDASHDGYAPCEHRRRVFALHGDLVVVVDLVTGDDARSSDVHWHLSPRWTVAPGPGGVLAACGGLRVDVHAPGGTIERFSADAAAGLGWHAPVYGCLEPSTTLRIRREGHAPLWTATVIGLRAAAPIERVDLVPVWAAAGVLDHSLALRIMRAETVDTFVIAESRQAAPEAPWRAADVESDAAMLWARVPRDHGRGASSLALVDASRARFIGPAGYGVDLRARVPDAFLDHHALMSFDDGRPDVRDCRIR